MPGGVGDGGKPLPPARFASKEDPPYLKSPATFLDNRKEAPGAFRPPRSIERRSGRSLLPDSHPRKILHI